MILLNLGVDIVPISRKIANAFYMEYCMHGRSLLMLFALLLSHSLPAQVYKPKNPPLYLSLDYPSYSQNGLFSMYLMVLGMVQEYDKGKLAGCEVDFGTEGVYYEPAMGPNWWEYYFEPIKLGSKLRAVVRKTTHDEKWNYALTTEHEIPKSKNHQYIEKYIHLKPHMNKKVSDFADTYFANHWMIGVHYRGTDKVIEAPRIAYNDVVNQINRVIELTVKALPYSIFVATDEQPFLDHMKEQFPDRVVYLEDGIRSTHGGSVHHSERELNYKKGEDAVLDCVLLSRCNILLRTSSNLSLVSTFINPDMPVIELSKRY